MKLATTPTEHAALLQVIGAQACDADTTVAVRAAWAAQRGWHDSLLRQEEVHAARRPWPLPDGGWAQLTVIRHPVISLGGAHVGGWQDRTTRADRAAIPGLGKWLHPPAAALRRAHGDADVQTLAHAGLERLSALGGGLHLPAGSGDAIIIAEGMSDWLTLHTILSAIGTRDAGAVWTPLGALGTGPLAALAALPANTSHHIAVIVDRDAPGAVAAKQLLVHHASNGARTLAIIPPHEDLTESHLRDPARTTTALQDALRKRRTGVVTL